MKAFSAIKYHFWNTRSGKKIQDFVILTVAPTNAVRWKPDSAHRLGAIYAVEHSRASRSQRIFANAIDPLRADYEMAHTIKGFKLIDCHDRKVIVCPQKREYVALSYVWGSSSSRSSNRSLPNPAPRVIEDAMTVTKELGFRYLWVDRYRISQVHDTEKHDQIMKMDQIYAGAEVTLVAAAGEGTDYGAYPECPRQVDVHNQTQLLASTIWYHHSAHQRRSSCPQSGLPGHGRSKKRHYLDESSSLRTIKSYSNAHRCTVMKLFKCHLQQFTRNGARTWVGNVGTDFSSQRPRKTPEQYFGSSLRVHHAEFVLSVGQSRCAPWYFQRVCQ